MNLPPASEATKATDDPSVQLLRAQRRQWRWQAVQIVVAAGFLGAMAIERYGWRTGGLVAAASLAVAAGFIVWGYRGLMAGSRVPPEA